MYPKNLSRILGTILTVFSLTLVSTTYGQIRLMPIGDGVVAGTGSSTSDVGGFRPNLYQFISTNGIPIDFVGSLDDGLSVDPHHEGHSGTTVSDLNQNLGTSLQLSRPHVVLLHLGTEELAQSGDVNNVLNGLSTTIDLIHGFSSETEIFVSSLIPSTDFLINANITSLNSQLQTLVDDKESQGVNVTLIDVNQAYQQIPDWQNNYMSSNIFPNDSGYGFLAQIYLNAILTISKYADQETFTDNFDGRFILGPNWTTHPKFKIKNDELENSSSLEVWDNQLAIVNSLFNPNTISYRFSLNADTTGILETGAAILLDSASTEASGFLVSVNSGLLRLFTLTNGELGGNIKNVAVNQAMPQPGDILQISWEFEGQNLLISAFLNETPYASMTYSTIPPGPNDIKYAGVLLRGGRNNNIDDFFISNEVDETRPAAVLDLALVQTGPTVAEVSFTATGDDSLTDKATKYDFRFATFPIDPLNFDLATPAVLGVEPGEPGTIESISLSGLGLNTQYYFALKVEDENSNKSAISNVVTGQTLEAINFSETFDREEIGNQWEASNGLAVLNGIIETSNSQDTWTDFAVLKSPVSPIETGFQWTNIIVESDADRVGLLLMLDGETLSASGYLIKRAASEKSFELWSLVNGEVGDLIDSFSDQNTNPVSGSVLRVFTYSDINGHHFLIFVDNVFRSVLTDSAKSFGNSAVTYSGIAFQGNSTVGVDNFFTYNLETQPSNLAYSSGDGQEGDLNQTLPEPLVVELTDDQGSPVYHGKVKFEVIEGSATFFPVTHGGGYIFIEAEEGALTEPMIVKEDSSASSGSYISTPAGTGDGGEASYTFYVKEDGLYSIWGRVIAPSGTEDSYFIQVDDQEIITWDVLQDQHQSDWTWDQAAHRGIGSSSSPEVDPYVVELSQGFHTMKVIRRDPGTLLDKIILTMDPFFQPVGDGGGEYFASDFSGLVSTHIKLNTVSGPVVVRAISPTLPGLEVVFNLTANADPAKVVSEYAGNNQTGTAGFPLPEPFSVFIADEYGNPIPNHSVFFEVIEGSGRLAGPDTVITSGDGLASATLILSSEGAENGVLAHAEGLEGSPIEFHASATGGIATSLEYVSGNNQTGLAGEVLSNPFEVRILDEQGDPVPGYPVLFEILSSLGGSLASDSAYANASGVVAMSLTLGPSIGEYVVQARAEGLVNSPIFFNAFSSAGAAFRLEKASGDSATGVAQFPLSNPLVVKVADQFGNPVGNTEVIFNIVSGGGSFDGNVTEISMISDSLGLAGATPILGSTVGDFTNHIQARNDSLEGSPVEFVASTRPATAFKIELVDGNSQIGIINKQLSAPFRVRVTNPIDEPIKNHPVTFTVVSGGGIFTETFDATQTVATNDEGLASVMFKAGPTTGVDVNVIHATAFGGVNPLSGSPIVFMASAKNEAASMVATNGSNQTGVINTTLSEALEVQVFDDEGNAISGHPVTFKIVSGGGSFVGTSDSVVVRETNISGKASVELNLGPESGLENNILQVSSSDGFQDLDGSPFQFTATAIKSRASMITPLSETHRSGIVGEMLSGPLQIKVTDSLGVPVASHEVTFAVISGNGRINEATSDSNYTVATNEAGIAEIQWVLGTTAGTEINQLVVTSDNGISELTNSPVQFDADGMADLTDVSNSSIIATSPVEANGVDVTEITVSLKDKYENPIPGKEIRLFSTGQLNFFTQPPTMTDSLGRAVGYMTSIKSQAKEITAKNNSDNIVLSSSALVDFTARIAQRVRMTAGNEQERNAGTPLKNPLVVTVTDAFGNPVANHPVTFSSKTEGGLILEEQPVYTDSFGFASSHFVLSETEGINFAEAAAEDLEGSPVLFSANGVAGVATKLLLFSGNNQTGVVSDTLNNPLKVQILDENNDPVKNVPIDFRFTIGTGQFVGSSSIVTDMDGIAAASAILGNELTSYVILASSSEVSGDVLFVIDAASSVAQSITLHSGNGQNVAVQQQSDPLVVRLWDSFSNPVQGSQVRFEVIEGEANILSGQPVTSNGSGLASCVIQAGTKSGQIQIKASLEDNPEITAVFAVQVTPSAANQIELVDGHLQVGTVGYFASKPLKARIVDMYGNPVPNEPVAFVVSSGNASVVGNQNRFTDSLGVVNCQIRIGNSPGEVVVLAIATKITGAVLNYSITAIMNQPPAISSETANPQVAENEALVFDFSISDPDGDSLTLSVTGLPDGALLTSESAEAWRISWTPNYDQSGSHPIHFMLSDGKGGIVQDSVTIEVLNINRPPQITLLSPTADTTLIQGRAIDFDIEAFDPDNEALEIAWLLNGEIVSETGNYHYEAGQNFIGDDNIEVFVTDLVDTLSFKWTITVQVSVELVQFSAMTVQASDAIQITWNTSSEFDNLGFDVLRSTRRDGEYSKINVDMIPANQDGLYGYTDGDVSPGINYYYKLVDRNIHGIITEHGPVQALIALPTAFRLEQNFPNPFSLKIGQGKTRINFQIPKGETVTIRVYNLLGQMVRTIVDKHYAPGAHNISWDGRDNDGKLVTSGVYYYRFDAGDFNDIKRLVIIR